MWGCAHASVRPRNVRASLVRLDLGWLARAIGITYLVELQTIREDSPDISQKFCKSFNLLLLMHVVLFPPQRINCRAHPQIRLYLAEIDWI